MVKMKGLTVPMVTPFTSDDKVDVEATRKLVDFLIESGVDGLYPCGTTGEMLKMTLEERKLFAETVVDQAKGRIPVWIQVGCATTKDTLELAQHALSIGCQGVGVVTPQYFGVNERETFNYYWTVANSLPADFPVYVYNIPQCAVNDISAATVQKLADVCPNIMGMKYSYTDFSRLKDYLLINDGNFDVIIGPDKFVLPAMAMGCVGAISGCAQAFPQPFVELFKALKAENYAEAREYAKRAMEISEMVHFCANIGYVKAALRVNGVINTHMRAPALDLTPEEEQEVAITLKNFKEKYNY